MKQKHSAIFGIRNLEHYDAGSLMTFAGLAVSLIGGVIALAGHVLEDNSLAMKQIRFPEDEAVAVTDYMFDNWKEDEEG